MYFCPDCDAGAALQAQRDVHFRCRYLENADWPVCKRRLDLLQRLTRNSYRHRPESISRYDRPVVDAIGMNEVGFAFEKGASAITDVWNCDYRLYNPPEGPFD